MKWKCGENEVKMKWKWSENKMKMKGLDNCETFTSKLWSDLKFVQAKIKFVLF